MKIPENSDVFHYETEPDSDTLLVIFSGVNAKTFMGYRLLSDVYVNKLFLRDPNRSWYNKSIPGLTENPQQFIELLEKITSAYSPDKILFIGSSMGGYAALLFGCLLKIQRIIVFSPQVILNSGLPNNPQNLSNYSYPDLTEIIYSNAVANIDYFFGMEELTDFYHLQSIYQLENIDFFCIRNSAHNVMHFLHQMQILQPLLIKIIHQKTRPDLPSWTSWKNPDVLSGLVKIADLYSQRNWTETLNCLDVLLEQYPVWSGAYTLQSELLRKQKKIKPAKLQAEKAILINPGYDLAYHELAMSEFALKNYDAAIERFIQSIKLNPTPKAMQFIKLCISYREQKQYREAYQIIKQGKLNFPKQFGMYFHSGRILELQHQFLAARCYYKKAAELNPLNPVIPEHIQRIDELINQHETSDKYTVFIGGDTILTRYMHSILETKGIDWICQDLEQLSNAADATLLNLECVLANSGKIQPKQEYRPYYYRGAPKLCEILTRLNTRLVFTANNHALDFGSDALLEQKKMFAEIGIKTPGSGANMSESMQAEIIQAGPINIAVISLFSYVETDVYRATETRPGIFHISDRTELINQLYSNFIQARTQADIVLCSPHWTPNWTIEPDKDLIYLAHQIIDIGFDGILGHSSHLLHGIEIYRGRPIVYDMGTILADFALGHMEMPYQAGFLLHCRKKRLTALEIVPLKLEHGRSLFAKGKDAVKIRQMIRHRSEKLDDTIEFFRHGENLLVEFESDQPMNLSANSEHEIPEEQSFKLNKLYEWQQQSPNVLVTQQSEVVKLDMPISLAEKGQITHIKFPESFYAGSGFLFQMIIHVTGHFSKGRHDIHLLAIHENQENRFYCQHPLSQGVYSPFQWQSGEQVMDSTVVRPVCEMITGQYELYLGFMDQYNQVFLQEIADDTRSVEQLIWIGSIMMLKPYRGNYASGVDWSGTLEHPS